MGTGSFLGVKRPGHGADHPLPSSAEVKKEESYTFIPLWAFGMLWGTFTFKIICNGSFCSDVRAYFVFLWLIPHPTYILI
jgi:hypothetical protein